MAVDLYDHQHSGAEEPDRTRGCSWEERRREEGVGLAGTFEALGPLL